MEGTNTNTDTFTREFVIRSAISLSIASTYVDNNPVGEYNAGAAIINDLWLE